MEPTIMTGDIILDSLAKRPVKQGMIITFKDDKDRTISHRVVKIANKHNQTYYTTKGDHNNAADPNEITDKDIIGFYSYRLPYLGIFIVNLRKPAGLFLMILIPTALTLLGDLLQPPVSRPQATIQAVLDSKAKKTAVEAKETEVIIENL